MQLVNDDAVVDLEDLPLRTFRDRIPEDVQYLTETPFFLGLLQWNSRLGVPMDVWYLISTSVMVCDSCDLARSFPAHESHLRPDGTCGDEGQALIILRDAPEE